MSQSVIDKGETLQCVLPDGKKIKCNSGVKKIPIQLYFLSYLDGGSQLMILCLVDRGHSKVYLNPPCENQKDHWRS